LRTEINRGQEQDKQKGVNVVAHNVENVCSRYSSVGKKMRITKLVGAFKCR